MRKSLLLICVVAVVAFGAGCQQQLVALQQSSDNANAVLYLEAHIEKPNFGGKMFCAYAEIPKVKNEQYELNTGYWLVTCQEYYVAGKELKEGTGVSIPVKAHLDPKDQHVLSIDRPNVASYESDLGSIFPKSMGKKIYKYYFYPDFLPTAESYFAKQLQK